MWGPTAVELGEKEYNNFSMSSITSNDTVQNLGIYAGLTAGAGAVGLAYGVEASSPVYAEQRKRNQQRMLEARNTPALPAPVTEESKDSLIAKAVAWNDNRREQREINQAKKRMEKNMSGINTDALLNVDESRYADDLARLNQQADEALRQEKHYYSKKSVQQLQAKNRNALKNLRAITRAL